MTLLTGLSWIVLGWLAAAAVGRWLVAIEERRLQRRKEEPLRGELYRVTTERIGGITVRRWTKLPDWPDR